MNKHADQHGGPGGHGAASHGGTEHAVAMSIDGQPILFPTLPYKNFHGRAEAFLQDEQMQRFVNNATLVKDEHRKKLAPIAFGERHPEWRQLAADIKQHTLDHLDYYLEQFAENARKAGAVVHFAKTAEEANAICVEIALREKCTSCVKSKSMVTEETHLLPRLEAIGCKTYETDLGEFIIQLDNDAPSHIVTPMIHKDRVAVAKAFQRELGARYTEDPQELCMIARDYLRDKYQEADLGISGGNFLVADTGSLVLCTNEGNGRFCTTAPRIHVAFVGIEKLVPNYDSLAVMLKLLARTATAQPLTVYTHIVTGPKRAHEHDGPEQSHIILIDNGRTNILRDKEYREALRCIRCGACLNACPVYRKATGHAYGAVYSGPIGAVITPLLKGIENYKELPGASSLCGACYEACPVKINIPELLIKLRRDQVSRDLIDTKDKVLNKMLVMGLGSPFLYKWGGWFQKHVLRALADGDGYIRLGLGPLEPWVRDRDFPAPAARNFRAWWNSRSKR
jgi:L-lactate dehydrogenase complex protein LldF